MLKKDSVITKLDIIGESPKNELKQFDEAFAEYKKGKPNDRIDTAKYFDNLVAFGGAIGHIQITNFVL